MATWSFSILYIKVHLDSLRWGARSSHPRSFRKGCFTFLLAQHPTNVSCFIGPSMPSVVSCCQGINIVPCDIDCFISAIQQQQKSLWMFSTIFASILSYYPKLYQLLHILPQDLFLLLSSYQILFDGNMIIQYLVHQGASCFFATRGEVITSQVFQKGLSY